MRNLRRHIPRLTLLSLSVATAIAVPVRDFTGNIVDSSQATAAGFTIDGIKFGENNRRRTATAPTPQPAPAAASTNSSDADGPNLDADGRLIAPPTSAPPADTAQQQSPAASAEASAPPGSPVFDECENNACEATWTFNGSQGTGTWTSGRRATFVVMELTPGSITLQRTDFSGSSSGMNAVYHGTIQGNRISGNVTWTWDNLNWPNDQVKGQWSATLRSGSMDKLVASNAPSPATPMSVCHSKQAKRAMQQAELLYAGNSGGGMLQALSCGMTGVCGSSSNLALVDAHTGNGGTRTPQEPGAFVCQALFVHDLKLTANQSTDATEPVTKAVMSGVLGDHPTFFEWFAIAPMPAGRFRATLLPGVIFSDQAYTQDFAYP